MKKATIRQLFTTSRQIVAFDDSEFDRPKRFVLTMKSNILFQLLALFLSKDRYTET